MSSAIFQKNYVAAMYNRRARAYKLNAKRNAFRSIAHHTPAGRNRKELFIMQEKASSRITEDSFYANRTLSSATDCTGLIPSAVLDEDEAQAYGELYAIHRQQAQNPEQ